MLATACFNGHTAGLSGYHMADNMIPCRPCRFLSFVQLNQAQTLFPLGSSIAIAELRDPTEHAMQSSYYTEYRRSCPLVVSGHQRRSGPPLGGPRVSSLAPCPILRASTTQLVQWWPVSSGGIQPIERL